MKSDFDVEVKTISDVASQEGLNGWMEYGFIIGVGSLGGEVDILLRKKEHRWPRSWTLKTMQPQYRGFVIVDEKERFEESGGVAGWDREDWSCYDVIYVSTDSVKLAIEEAKSDAGAGTHVVWQIGIGLKTELKGVGKDAIEAFILDWRRRGIERVDILDEGGEVCVGQDPAGKATVVLADARWDGRKELGSDFTVACDNATLIIRPEEVWKLYLVVVSTPYVDITGSLIQPSTIESTLALIADDGIVTEEVRGLPGWVKGGAGGGELKDKFGLDEIDRGEAIMYGLTRSMCLGRSAATLNVKIWGVEGGLALEGGVIFTVHTPGWVGGRDGSWCILLNGELVTCIQQDGLGLKVDFEGKVGRIENIKVELKGNVYNDVVRTWEGGGFEVREGSGIGEGLKGWGGRTVVEPAGRTLR